MGVAASEMLATPPGASAYLFGAWYVAAFSTEVGEGALFGRTILERPVLLFRDKAGAIAAISDRRPHRFAPLHRGFLDVGRVRCGYHGLGFDRSGACVVNPHGSTAHYELMSDNVLDLSHVEYLHPALGAEAVGRAKVEVVQGEDGLTTTLRTTDEVLPTGLAAVYQAGDQRVDRTMRVAWQAPATMLLEVTVEPAAGSGTWRRGSQTLHIFTPETAGSTHYFYVGCMSRSTATQALADQFLAALGRAFVNEDKPMIEAQQAMVGTLDIMDCHPALFPINKASIIARRALARLIAEQGQCRSIRRAERLDRPRRDWRGRHRSQGVR